MSRWSNRDLHKLEGQREYNAYVRHNQPRYNYADSIEENVLRSYNYAYKYNPRKVTRNATQQSKDYIKFARSKMKPFQEAEERGIRPPFSKQYMLTYRTEDPESAKTMKPLPKGWNTVYDQWNTDYETAQDLERAEAARLQDAQDKERLRIMKMRKPIRTPAEKAKRSMIFKVLHREKKFIPEYLNYSTTALNRIYYSLGELEHGFANIPTFKASSLYNSGQRYINK